MCAAKEFGWHEGFGEWHVGVFIVARSFFPPRAHLCLRVSVTSKLVLSIMCVCVCVCMGARECVCSCRVPFCTASSAPSPSPFPPQPCTLMLAQLLKSLASFFPSLQSVCPAPRTVRQRGAAGVCVRMCVCLCVPKCFHILFLFMSGRWDFPSSRLGFVSTKEKS